MEIGYLLRLLGLFVILLLLGALSYFVTYLIMVFTDKLGKLEYWSASAFPAGVALTLAFTSDQPYVTPLFILAAAVFGLAAGLISGYLLSRVFK
jgi:putative flippase GtrA